MRTGEHENIVLGTAILPSDGFQGDEDRELLIVDAYMDAIVEWSIQDRAAWLASNVTDYAKPAPLGPGRRPALWWKHRAPEPVAVLEDGYESEAGFLRRLGLLLDQEQGNVPPEAFAPVATPPSSLELRAVLFINELCHTKGRWSGRKFDLRSWQLDNVIRPLFGTLRSDGLRQYRRCLLELPRKNGKSELAAAIALYMFLADGEAAAQVRSAAGDRDQATLVWDVAADMVRMSARLSKQVEIRDSHKLMRHTSTRSSYKAIPAEADLKHGLDASCVIYDELHVAKNRHLYDALDSSMGSRLQPLHFIPTTAGFDRNSVCFELHDEGLAVLRGALARPAFLPVIYSAPEDADWTDPETWRRYNPALGDFRSEDEIIEKFGEARDMPARENRFRRLYLCQWVQQAERWIPMEQWRACDEPLRDLEDRPCWAAIDLSSTTDLTAVVYVFPDTDGSYDVMADFFTPEEGLARRGEIDRAPYKEWADQGWLTPTPGQVVDYDTVCRKIDERRDDFAIEDVGYDPWNAGQVVRKLEEVGFLMLKYRQTYERMSPPMKELERLIADGKIRHGGNPVLDWMAEQVAAKEDEGGNMKPVKPHKRARIDGIVALIMAIGGQMKAPQKAKSVYEDRGLLFV